MTSCDCIEPQMLRRPYLEHFSLGSGQCFQLLLALLLAPAKGPLHAGAFALVSCHFSFLQKVVWQQLLKPKHDFEERFNLAGQPCKRGADVHSGSASQLRYAALPSPADSCTAFLENNVTKHMQQWPVPVKPGVEGSTLNLRPCRPATLLSTDLIMSHFMRLNRSTQRPSKSSYTCASSSTLKSLMLKGAPYT